MSYDPNPEYSNPEDEDVDDVGEDSVVQLRRSQIRAMERDAKAFRQAEAQRQELEAQAKDATRELAFLRAQVDTESPIGKLFAKTYEGELEPEAVKAAWAELNGQEPVEKPAEEDVKAAQTREQLAEGARGDTGEAPPVDARVQARAEGEEALNKGASRDDAMATMFGSLVGAAAEGDSSVIIED